MYQAESCLSLSIVCLFYFVPFSCAVRVSFEVFSCRLFSLFELKNEEEMKGGIRMKLALAFKYLFILFFLATNSLLIFNFGKRSKGARSQLLLLFFFFLLATDKTFTRSVISHLVHLLHVIFSSLGWKTEGKCITFCASWKALFLRFRDF